MDRVGVYGTSAGGLTALTLAGARWSPANFMRHCLAHMREDFPGCVGLITSLRGNVLDPVKLTLAQWVHRLRFNDETLYGLTDPRIKAVIASVPMAAPIDLATMARPRTAVGLIKAEQDRWLAPRFHIDAVRAAPHCWWIRRASTARSCPRFTERSRRSSPAISSRGDEVAAVPHKAMSMWL